MIVTILKKDFSDAVTLVSRFAEKRAGVAQALSGVALLAGGDGIKLRATNLETGIDITVPGTIEKQGVALIPGGILKEVAGSLSGSQPLTIEHIGDTITISSGSSRSVIKTLSYEEFPGISLPEDKISTFTISGVMLKELFQSVAPYASLSTIRPELASVLLKSEGGIITAVATDSFRLAEKSMQLKKSVDSFSFLIPAKKRT
jgi:DNA polymerase-3 subunit beta